MRGACTAGLAMLLVTACSGPGPVEEVTVDMAEAEQGQQGPVVADPVEWDTPIVVGGFGGEMEVTPAGIRYVSTEEISSPTEHDHPFREVFAVVRFTVTTGAGSVSLPHGWGWRQGGQEYGPGDGGNSSTAPWAGAIPQVHADSAILGGEDPTVGYETFDLDGRGGELTFTDAEEVMVRWEVPEQDQGEVPELDEWLTAQ